MSLLKCELCGNAFNSLGAKLCAACAVELDKSYMKVRKHLYQNPDRKSFAAIIESTQISEKHLNYLIDHGRIVVDVGTNRGVRCKACGTITSGESLCEKCRNKLISEKLISVPFAAAAKDESKKTDTHKVRDNDSSSMIKKNNIIMLKKK